jgi:hypothetical protein
MWAVLAMYGYSAGGSLGGAMSWVTLWWGSRGTVLCGFWRGRNGGLV